MVPGSHGLTRCVDQGSTIQAIEWMSARKAAHKGAAQNLIFARKHDGEDAIGGGAGVFWMLSAGSVVGPLLIIVDLEKDLVAIDIERAKIRVR